MSTTDPIQNFSSVVKDWFSNRFISATEAQALVWNTVHLGEHLLLTSPTGTGKTLAAFLTAIDCLLSGIWPAGALSVLYVSPLKALNRDIQLNLLTPLKEIEALATDKGLTIPSIKIETRSGDTSAYRRRRILSHPPEILITTPESLNILISTPSGYSLFSGLKCVILDEIHNIAGTKRGTHLITAVERLVQVSGEFQRIGLSATLSNPRKILEFLAGFRCSGDPRKAVLLQSGDSRKIELKIDVVPQESTDETQDTPWKRLITKILPQLHKEKSTLIFVNSRRLAEKLTYLLNLGREEPLAYAHHGSLSREIRQLAENRLKNGQLQCIVATNSLELGIDIGDLDHIILVETPLSLSSAFQKLGRAGHSVGETSRGTLYCTHGRDLLAAAALSKALLEKRLEETVPPEMPLDVLSQIIVSELVRGDTDLSTLFSTLQRSWPYRNLDAESFHRVVEMLQGFYQGIKFRQLPVFLHKEKDQWVCTSSARSALFSSGGTIPDRGYYTLKYTGSGRIIGELDEEFVWERKIGDIFSYASRQWRITGINSQVMEVLPTPGTANSSTFFIAEPFIADNTIHDLTRNILDSFSSVPDVKLNLQKEFSFTSDAAEKLSTFLDLQTIQSPLPGETRIILESTRLPDTGNFLEVIFIHTFRGGRINAPLGLILQTCLKNSGCSASVSWDNDSLLIVSPEKLPENPIKLINMDDISDLLTEGLSSSGIFGARFREAAGRSLILSREGFGKRTPLWLSRLRAKRLYNSLSQFPGFPLLQEAAAECLHHLFDLSGLKRFLQDIFYEQIEVCTVSTACPSPFCSSILWQQVNTQIYSDDVPETTIAGTAEWAERISSGEFRRPALDNSIVEDFLSRLRRATEDYRPRSGKELNMLVRERQYISVSELSFFISAMEETFIVEQSEFAEDYRGWVGIKDRMESLQTATPDDVMYKVFTAWFYYAGPLRRDEVINESLKSCPFTAETAIPLLNRALNEGLIIEDCIRGEQGVQELISREAYEQLLRFARARKRSESFNALTLDEFSALLPAWQKTGDNSSVTEICMLFEGLPIKKPVWDTVVFPLRADNFTSADIDKVLSTRELFFTGGASGSCCFWHINDRDLMPCHNIPEKIDIPVPLRGAYSFWELSSDYTGTNSELSETLQKLLFGGVLCTDTWDHSTQIRMKAPSRRGRKNFSRWQKDLPIRGNWFRRPVIECGDSLEELEKAKERVRLLFERYPVLFREMLYRETKPFRWADIFQALRLMEFSGEVISGIFIEQIPGLQFIMPETRETLRNFVEKTRYRLLHVQDPASLSGMPADQIKRRFPQRRGDIWYTVQGGQTILSFSVRGGSLQIWTDEAVHDAFQFFCDTLLQSKRLIDKIQIKTINDLPASESQYISLLENQGFARGYNEYTLWQHTGL